MNIDLLSCDTCGALVDKDRVETHIEFHKMVEESLAGAALMIYSLKKRLDERQPE